MHKNRLINLFPLTIYQSKIEIDEEYKNELIKNILDDEKKNPKNSKGSWTGDVMGNEYLHNIKLFEKLYSFISEHIKIYFGQLGINQNHISVNFQRSWATISRQDQAISEHIHSQSHISFAYYLKFPDKSGGIFFKDDKKSNEIIKDIFQINSMKQGLITGNQLNADIVRFEPKENDIFIFPSKALHGTYGGKNNEPRISMSSDILLTLNENQKKIEKGIPDPSLWKKF